MANLTKLAIIAAHFLLLALTAVAGYAYSQIRYLNLPISQALALFTVVLPFTTGISLRGTAGLIARSKKGERNQLIIPLIGVIGFQLIYETIVGTLALTNILPPSSLVCGLRERWMSFFNMKNERAVKAIQESLKCCGLGTVKDHGWPFKSPTACLEIFGWDQPCLGKWRQAQQINAGLLLLVAVLVFILKVLALFYLSTNESWLSRHKTVDAEEDNRATMRRLIGDGPTEEAYRDEPDSNRAIEAPNGNRDQGPRVEPSQLVHGDNHWRNEET